MYMLRVTVCMGMSAIKKSQINITNHKLLHSTFKAYLASHVEYNIHCMHWMWNSNKKPILQKYEHYVHGTSCVPNNKVRN